MNKKIATTTILLLLLITTGCKNNKAVDEPETDKTQEDTLIVEEEPYTTFNVLKDTWDNYYPSEEIWPVVELEDYDLKSAEFINEDDKELIDSSHYLYISDNPEDLTAIALHANNLEFNDYITLVDRVTNNLKAMNKSANNKIMVATVNKEYIIIIDGTEDATGYFIAAVINSFDDFALFDEF